MSNLVRRALMVVAKRRAGGTGDPLLGSVKSLRNFATNGSDFISGWTIIREAPSYSDGAMLNLTDSAETGLVATKAGSALTTQNFTVDGVFEYIGFNSNGINVIFDTRISEFGAGFLIYVINAGGAKLRVSDTVGGYAATVNLVLSTNTKYYFALKRSGTTWELYVGLMGGALTSASTTCLSNVSGSNVYFLGNHYGGTTYSLRGKLHSFRITEALRDVTTAPLTEDFPEA